MKLTKHWSQGIHRRHAVSEKLFLFLSRVFKAEDLTKPKMLDTLQNVSSMPTCFAALSGIREKQLIVDAAESIAVPLRHIQ